jgi:hypothetical protein
MKICAPVASRRRAFGKYFLVRQLGAALWLRSAGPPRAQVGGDLPPFEGSGEGRGTGAATGPVFGGVFRETPHRPKVARSDRLDRLHGVSRLVAMPLATPNALGYELFDRFLVSAKNAPFSAKSRKFTSTAPCRNLYKGAFVEKCKIVDYSLRAFFWGENQRMVRSPQRLKDTK